MKITPNLNTNARYYCNAVQLGMPLDLESGIDKKDMVFSFLDAIEGVDLRKYVKPIRSNNTNSHDRCVMLSTVFIALNYDLVCIFPDQYLSIILLHALSLFRNASSSRDINPALTTL